MKLARVLGAGTAGYGIALLVRPELLLRPSGMLRDDSADPRLAVLVRTLAVRDVASGLAMVLARGPRAMRTALAVRVLSDLGDLVVLGIALRGRPERTTVMAVAGGWAAVCALSARGTRAPLDR